MSFRGFPFHGSSRYSRFGTRSQEDRNMFYDNPINRTNWNDLGPQSSHFEGPTWRTSPTFSRHSGSAPSSPQTQHTDTYPHWSGGDSIPIKVIHEKSDKKVPDATTQGSNPSVNTSTHEPKIRHIPITVEPREGSNAKYTTDKRNEKSSKSTKLTHNTGNDDLQDCSGSQNQRDNDLAKKVNVSHSSNDTTQLNGNNSAESLPRQPRVRHIPITVEQRTERSPHPSQKHIPKKPSPFQDFPPRSNSANQPFEGPAFSTRKTESSPHLSEQQKPSNKQQSNKTPAGPHITKIPLNTSNISVQKNETQISESDLALEQIAKVKTEVTELKNKVDAFSGTFQDKQYRYLDEMLTRCMLKLDNIETGGIDEIRKARKLVVNEVQKCISLLESKISRTNEKPAVATIETQSQPEEYEEKKTAELSKEVQKTVETYSAVPVQETSKEKISSEEKMEIELNPPMDNFTKKSDSTSLSDETNNPPMDDFTKKSEATSLSNETMNNPSINNFIKKSDVISLSDEKMEIENIDFKNNDSKLIKEETKIDEAESENYADFKTHGDTEGDTKSSLSGEAMETDKTECNTNLQNNENMDTSQTSTDKKSDSVELKEASSTQ